MRRLLAKVHRLSASVVDPRVWMHVLRLAHHANYSHVQPMRQARIGPGTAIAPNVSLRNGARVRIGRGAHVGEGSSLWAGDVATVTLGEHALLGPGVYITASNYETVAGVPVMDQPHREADVVVGARTWLGRGVIVLPGVTIGDECIVGAGAVVTSSLPAGSIAVGVPARVVGQR